MALVVRTSLTRLILAWDNSGIFKGGDASWTDRVVDDETDEEIAARERVAVPIAGSLQPGTPLSQVLGSTETQRLASLDTEKRRADALQVELDGLRGVAAPTRG